jgi:hypothetical protein
MDRLLRIARVVLTAPLRFLDWVYQPGDRRGPTRGEAIVHMQAGGMGQDTTRWMAIETDSRQREVEEVERVR